MICFMQITRLDNKTTVQLEALAEPISKLIDPDLGTMFSILSWHTEHHLVFPVPFHKKVAKLSDLLGYRPNYHKVTPHRVAVWGLALDVCHLLLYYSVDGIQVRSTRAYSKEQLDDALNKLSTILRNKKSLGK